MRQNGEERELEDATRRGRRGYIALGADKVYHARSGRCIMLGAVLGERGRVDAAARERGPPGSLGPARAVPAPPSARGARMRL